MKQRRTTSIILFLATVCVFAADGWADDNKRSIRPDPLSYVSPSRDFDTIHTRLDLDLDLKHQTIAGSVTHTLRALKSDLVTIRLNCVGLNIDEVLVDGKPVDFEHPVPGDHSTSWIEGADTKESTEVLAVYLDRPLSKGQEFELTVTYNGAPKEGLYFVTPEKGIAEKRYEVWAQGEGEDNRYWIPSFDYPNDKATFDGIFRVEKGMYVLSNGVLVEKKDVGDKTQYHWRLDTPQVSYLITVAAGEYQIYEERWRDVPVMYVVPPGTDRATVDRAYDLTPKMMEFFSDYIGIDYPFKKYAQVVVQNFIYGGMENTTVTVMNMRTLFDEHTLLTRDEQGLVAHELAHQWWGDMVTCKEWSHMWLNEGFATYFQALFRENYEGDDAFRYEVDRRHRNVIDKDKVDARPIVVDFYNRKDTRNSSNVYTKGSSVLHMLRFLIGDELFRESIRNYGTRFKYQVAETRDFTQVVNETTGENLDWFFEQWVYLAGHPKLEVTKHWDPKNNTLKLSVSQTQKVEDLTPIFRLPVDVEITCEEKTAVYRIVVDKASQDFYFSLPSRPLMVIFDKSDWTLKTLKFPKPTDELVYQLKNGDAMERVRAARALAKKGRDQRGVDALAEVLASDDFWGVRREAALALGKIGSEDASSVLLAATGDDNARVRLAVTEAMGSLKPAPEIDDALLLLIKKDPAYEVQAMAVTSLAKMKSSRAKKACLDALKIDSDRDFVRNAGLRGLVKIRATDAMARIKPLTKPGNRRTYRHEAIRSYAALAKKLESEPAREDAAEFLASMLDDWYLRTRRDLIAALSSLGEKSVLDALQRVSNTDPVEHLRRRAEGAIAKIESQSEDVAESEALRTRVQTLAQQIEELQRELKTLQAKLPERETETEKLSRKEGD